MEQGQSRVLDFADALPTQVCGPVARLERETAPWQATSPPREPGNPRGQPESVGSKYWTPIRWHILAGLSQGPTPASSAFRGALILPMPIFLRRLTGSLRSFPNAPPRALAWLLALGLCAWVAAELFWQFAAPQPVAALARHEPDPRKVAVRIGLHVGRAVPAADSAPARAAIPDARYTVTGIATGFGALPGFVILQADDGSTLSLSPGQALPDGRRLVRLLPETAEFELDGRRSSLALPARGGEPGDALRPPTPVADGGPRRDHR